jgi:hypothetical protein
LRHAQRGVPVVQVDEGLLAAVLADLAEQAVDLGL